MEFFLQNKRYLFLFGGILFFILCLILFSFSLFLSEPSPQNQNTDFSPTPYATTPVPTAYDPYSEEYKDSVKKIDQEEKAIIQQDQKVAKFLTKLPMQGINFIAAYDIDTNKVRVTIPTSKSAEGEKEFDDFLKANGIENRSWIQNLSVQFVTTDPDVH
ncbi:MAG: hypothetical protein KBD46_03840 [Candidatus Levybacteria bacterium]|nr:hypothetical protein [Candidatus Levybacteria bacterium]